jgi:hypothetical protein
MSDFIVIAVMLTSLFAVAWHDKPSEKGEAEE